MAAPLKDVLDYLGVPLPEFIDEALTYLADLEYAIAEEIFSWFGIEDEIILTASVISNQLFDTEDYQKEELVRIMNNILQAQCNVVKDLTETVKERNAFNNAKMNKPYYVAKEQTWSGFGITSNLVALKLDVAGLQPIVETSSGRTPIVITGSSKHYPLDIETVLYKMDKDSSANYLGDSKLKDTDGRTYLIVGTVPYLGELKVAGKGQITVITYYRTTKNVITTIAAGVDPDPDRTTITTEYKYHTDMKYGDLPREGWVLQNSTSSSVTRDFETGDVAGTVTTYTYSDTAVVETKIFTKYPYLALVDHVVTHYTFNGIAYVDISFFHDLPEEVASRVGIDELEMMPLIRLREGTANVNGITDTQYEAYTARALDGGSFCADYLAATGTPHPDCLQPKSVMRIPGDADYDRYRSTSEVLRGIGLQLDAAVGMICIGQDDLDKISSGFIRFGINPGLKKVKRGIASDLGRKIKLEDATASQKESINGVLQATWEFFELMADGTDFPEDIPTGWEAITTMHYYGFSAPGFNQALALWHIEDKFNNVNAVPNFPLFHVTSSITGSGELFMTKQITPTVQRILNVRGLSGTTSISRKVPENEDGSGPLVDAVDLVGASLKGDSESLLLLPLSLQFSRNINSIDKAELFTSSCYLQIYASETQYLDYYETEAFIDFMKVVLVIVSIIITIVTWGAGWWIGPLIGAMLLAGGYAYAYYSNKKMEAANAALEAKLAELSEKLQKDLDTGATADMQDMVLTLTDIVQIIQTNSDKNIPLPHEVVVELSAGESQYKNDMLYKEKYDIYCNLESKNEFKQ